MSISEVPERDGSFAHSTSRRRFGSLGNSTLAMIFVPPMPDTSE